MKTEVAGHSDLVAVMNVLDGGDLEVSAGTVERGIDTGRVLVARSERGTIIGALVGQHREKVTHIEGIAVRPGRRGQGIGTELLREAGDRWGGLEAEFDSSVSQFYRRAGFDVETGERWVGRRSPR